jgi:hypothetical protein
MFVQIVNLVEMILLLLTKVLCSTRSLENDFLSNLIFPQAQGWFTSNGIIKKTQFSFTILHNEAGRKACINGMMRTHIKSAECQLQNLCCKNQQASVVANFGLVNGFNQAGLISRHTIVNVLVGC